MYQGNKLLVSLLFGAVTFGCCLISGLVGRPIHQRIVPWRIWHETLAVLVMVLFIGICNFLVFSVVFHFSITLSMFLLFLYWTLIIGVFVTICSVSLNYYRYLRNQLEALLNKTTEEQSDITVTIHDTTVRGNDLLLPINDLLYVEAQKNNVSVCYVKE
jgi:membrane protein implicated in regulation of membrane protease activity